MRSSSFFFNDTATTEIYTLSLHDALPIYKRKLGHTQGRLPLPKTNLRRVRPRDFPEESFLAEFAVAPFFTVRPYLAPDKALTRQRGPKFQSYDCCWMTLAGYGLDGRKQTGLPRYALRQARLGRTGAPRPPHGAALTRRGAGPRQGLPGR